MNKPVTLEKEMQRFPTIDAGVRIGHIHLKVADLQRALDFYVGVLGFELTTSRPGAAFISAGGYHHHIGLNTWESRGGSPPAPGSTGLYHTAILYPTRRLLADALRRLIVAKNPAGRRQRPRRQRGALPARPRRQRRRALLGPPQGDVAEAPRRRLADVHQPARFARAAGGAGQAGGVMQNRPAPRSWGSTNRSDTCGGKGARSHATAQPAQMNRWLTAHSLAEAMTAEDAMRRARHGQGHVPQVVGLRSDRRRIGRNAAPPRALALSGFV